MRQRTTGVVVLVDSELVAMGFVVALSTRRHLHVAAVAHTPVDGLRAITRFDPAVVLLDSAMAGALIGLARTPVWRARLLLLGRNAHLGVVPGAERDVACGFISWTARRRHYLPLVDEVSACAQRQASPDSAQCSACTARRTLVPPPLDLSEREREVFVRIGSGQRTADIAVALGLSAKTVEAHRETIKYKLGMDSVRELNVVAASWCRGEIVDAAQPPLRGGLRRRDPL
ncbi:response regulator transcription factor [Tahibacter caeni]|uniref:response regulator transcription factor n=1 Tax=Tahibacter caeni TaxID=1453545 RepID=UPI002148D9EA|nr:LuxR C-terminal-related transcriptional regulator [Tahibacter caeni]